MWVIRTLVGCIMARRVARIFVRGGHDDGGTEGPERGAEARSAGAPRGVGSAEGRRMPPENFRKINVEIAHFRSVLATSGV